MRTISVLRTSFLLVSAACLMIAYLLGGNWLIVPVLLSGVAFCTILGRKSVLWRSSCLLGAYAAMAAIGVMTDLSVALIAVAITAALAAWDLANFRETLKMALGPEVRLNLVRSHLQSLCVALGAGMLIALSTLWARIDLPFAATGALALVLVAALMSAAPSMLGLDR